MLGDSTARFAVPLDPRLRTIVPVATRTYLKLHHLPRVVAKFITQRITEAVTRLTRSSGEPPVRVRVTLLSRGGRVRVVLQVGTSLSSARRLAPLARGAPPSVRAVYRPGRRGATLSFTSDRPRRD